MNSGRAYDEQGLPWLEAVDDEDGPRGISARRMLAALLLVIVAAVVVAGAFFWLGQRDPAVTGAPQLIRAQPGPYKVKPTDPGGLDVAGDSETAFSTSAGEDPDSTLDTARMEGGPPPPLTNEMAPAAEPKPKKIPPNETKEPVADPAVPPAPAGPTIQLGAYASTVKADTAWKLLSGRFPEVAALNKMVIGATVAGKPIYRLRAAGSSDQTRAACAALRAGGENCLVVN